HLGPFLFALTVLTGLLFINTVARRLLELAGKGLELSIVLEVFALSLPHILALTLPMAVLVAVLYAFSTLSAENEITALKASGTNLVRLLAPLVVAGFLLAGFMVWFNDQLLPESNHRLKNLLSDVARKSPTFELKEQVINPIRTQRVRTQYYLQAATIDHAAGMLRDVVIYDLSAGNKARTVYADSGRMAFNASQTDLLLTLYDGWIHELDSYKAKEFQRVDYGEYQLMIEGVGDEFERLEGGHRSDREMSLAMLAAAADSYRVERDSIVRHAAKQNELMVLRTLAGPESQREYPERSMPPSAGGLAGGLSYRTAQIEAEARDFMSVSDNMARRASVEANALNRHAESLAELAAQYMVEYHKKFAIPFACIVFVLLGAPLAVRFPRGGVGMVIGFSMLVFGIYYISLIGGETLGDHGLVAPYWGPWGPNMVFLAVALWGLSRIGRETSTARGGGWDDLWSTLRGILTRRRAASIDGPDGRRRPASGRRQESGGIERVEDDSQLADPPFAARNA
ncbi:MAG: LptF/LptG family permease, partial [Longimicrobiales bacterium]